MQLNLKIVRPADLNENQTREFEENLRQNMVMGLMTGNGMKPIEVVDMSDKSGKLQYLHFMPNGMTMVSLEPRSVWVLNKQGGYILARTASEKPDASLVKHFYAVTNIKTDKMVLTLLATNR